MTKSKTARADYQVTVAREIAGMWREEGETVKMTPRQAKYYLPPHGVGLTPVTAKTATKSKSGGDKSAAKPEQPDS